MTAPQPMASHRAHLNSSLQNTPDAGPSTPAFGAVVPSAPLSRSYQIAWLNRHGEAQWDTVTGPALPVVESACSSLARGALVATTEGPVAVEDLIPGMEVITSEFGPLPLRWIGSYALTRDDTQARDTARLFRVTADTFGPGKPSQDLLLAPRAHVLIKHSGCQALFGVETAFGPIRAFADGVTVIPVSPMSQVSIFNLAFDRQATILANGIEVESFHPGPHSSTLLDEEMLFSLLKLFPHVKSLDDFGPQDIDRLTSFEVSTLRHGA